MAEEDWATWRIGSGYLSVGPHSEVKGKNASPGHAISTLGQISWAGGRRWQVSRVGEGMQGDGCRGTVSAQHAVPGALMVA